MDRILADDFILVTGSGKTYTKSALLADARNATTIYEHQEDSEKTVPCMGRHRDRDRKSMGKSTENGKSFDYKLWFSDAYRRTPTGWRYVFAQSAHRACDPAP